MYRRIRTRHGGIDSTGAGEDIAETMSFRSLQSVWGFSLVRLFSRPAITIIVYHRIIEDDAIGIVPYIPVRRVVLWEQMQLFKGHYRAIPLAQAVKLLQSGRIDAHYLSVAFDDGYRSNYILGLELFKREGILPTIFVTTGCIETQQMLWPD